MLRRRLLHSTFVLLPFALLGCGETAPPDPRTQPPLVRTATVEAASASARSFTGTIAARVQSDLGFRVPGKVLERLVDTGQAVKRGQPLMRIDPADLKLAAQAQQEAVTAARARARQTADDEARHHDLVSVGAVSASAYDQAKAAADAARAQLSAAQAQAEVALNATRYAELVADADGVVMETRVDAGQVVSAGQVVVRIARHGPREAVVQLPETLRPALGSSAGARLFGREAAASPATLRQLSQTADSLTRTFEARYVLQGALANAPLGTTVTVQVADAGAAGHASLKAPLGALFDAGQGPGVWVIAGKPTQVSWRPVTVLGLDEESVRITGALKAGDSIVALGAHLLREGQEVRLADTSAVELTAGVRP